MINAHIISKILIQYISSTLCIWPLVLKNIQKYSLNGEQLFGKDEMKHKMFQGCLSSFFHLKAHDKP